VSKGNPKGRGNKGEIDPTSEKKATRLLERRRSLSRGEKDKTKSLGVSKASTLTSGSRLQRETTTTTTWGII